MTRIRKPVDKLTPADLEQYPVWEFALDEEGEEGQDATTVRSVFSASPHWSRHTFVVAQFTLADGSRMVGHCTPATGEMGGLVFEEPVIVTEAGQVFFYYGILKPSAEELRRRYHILGKEAHEVFPITFKPLMGMAAGEAHETIEAFSYLAAIDGPVAFVK